jgi:hypothetical protein
MTLWKDCLAVTLFAALAAMSTSALAQGAGQAVVVPANAPTAASALQTASEAVTQPAPPVAPAAQGAVQWTLQVMRDGQQIDSFDGTTTVGQARTDTHHKVVSHNVGCKDQPAGSIDLSRTITVSPLRADSNAIILAIDAQETLENDSAPNTPEGCKLPPQPRQVNASHPGLVVPPGQWVNWQIVDQNPSLAYRVRASLAPQAAQ